MESKKNAKELEKIVKERRIACIVVYERMADEYVEMSESILRKYLEENPELAFCSKFAVEIRGIDISKEELNLGDVICIKSDELGLKDFVEPEKYLTNEIFEQGILCEEIMPFVKALRDRGFQPKISDIIAPLEVLYPFFSI